MKGCTRWRNNMPKDKRKGLQSSGNVSPALPRISEAELVVMKVVWNQAPITTNQVVGALEHQVHWKPKTIHTLLRRLVRKGALAFEKQGREYLFRRAGLLSRGDWLRNRLIGSPSLKLVLLVLHGVTNSAAGQKTAHGAEAANPPRLGRSRYACRLRGLPQSRVCLLAGYAARPRLADPCLEAGRSPHGLHSLPHRGLHAAGRIRRERRRRQDDQRAVRELSRDGHPS